jgi:hypothetical protein
MKSVSVMNGVVELADKIVDRSGPEMLVLVLVLVAVIPLCWGWLLRQRRP